MKVRKNGTIKLEQNEVRAGNFFFKRDGDEMKITDLNGVFRFSAVRNMPIGIWLENVWALAMNGDENAIHSLEIYASAMWSCFSVAPDNDYLLGLLDVSHKAIERHPEWYGYDRTDDDSANDEAAQEVREMKEFEQELKDMDGNGAGEEE